MDKEDSSIDVLTGRQDCIDAVSRLIHEAQRHVAIFSQNLEPTLYNHTEICEALALLARSNRMAEIRIIAKDTRSILSEGHCLVPLAQRLSSFIKIRNPATPELQRFGESWLIVDDQAMCRINNPDRYEGKLIQSDRLEIKNQLEYFDLAWENSTPDPNIRSLNI